MNICILATNFLPHQGGAEYAIHHLTQALRTLGHRVTILKERTPDSRFVTYPYPVRESPRLPLCPPKLNRWLHLGHHHRREKFDVVHAHILWTGLDYVIRKLHNRLRLPVVATPHGGDVQVVPEIAYGMCRDPIVAESIRAALRAADFVTAVSQRIRSTVIERGADPIRVRDVPYGTEFQAIQRMHSPNLRATLGLTGDDFVILSVGRNSHVKDMPTLIEGFRIAAEKDSAVKAILVGPDEEIRQMIRDKRLEERVRVLGRIPTGYDPGHPTEQVFATPYPEMISAYRASDVYVATSYIESFNMSALDAFACGRPVIITNTHGFMDALEEAKNGFSVPVRNPSAVAEKILALARNRELCREMGRAALRKAAEYDWERVVDRYISVYEEAIASVRAG